MANIIDKFLNSMKLNDDEYDDEDDFDLEDDFEEEEPAPRFMDKKKRYRMVSAVLHMRRKRVLHVRPASPLQM